MLLLLLLALQLLSCVVLTVAIFASKFSLPPLGTDVRQIKKPSSSSFFPSTGSPSPPSLGLLQPPAEIKSASSLQTQRKGRLVAVSCHNNSSSDNNSSGNSADNNSSDNNSSDDNSNSRDSVTRPPACEEEGGREKEKEEESI